ncbi:WD40 repeat-like protein, partial [Colletotrichum sublineola]
MTWDTRLQSLSGVKAFISTVVYSPCGQWLLSGSEDGTVKLWHADSGNCERTHVAGVRSVAFSGDGESFTAGSLNGIIKVWNMENDKVETFRGHRYPAADDGNIDFPSFTADGQWLASTSRSGTIKIWDTLTEDLEQNITDLDDFRRAMVSFDGQWIASGGFSVRLWEAKTGRLIKELEGDFENEPGHVQSLAFSDDGKLLAASFHYSIYVWDTTTHGLVWKNARCGSDICSLSSSPDSQRLVSACSDHTIKVWDLPNGNENMTDEHPSRYVELMASSTDGRLLAYSFRRRSRYTVYDLKIWDTAT